MTGPATVSEPMITKTATATALSVVLRPAWAMDPAAARVRARFFGFTPESNAPNTNERTGVNLSIASIHFGIVGVSPCFGRLRHRLNAPRINASPSSTLTVSTVSD